ncbi:MAG TPA: magnesium transporter [Candidatus Nanoarchaeia archaeon]|nr:magnesium transporter [Candidatus Nanoarchaeia archaeon]
MKFYKKILKESIKILIFASIVSSIGGIGIEALKIKIAAIIPLVIMLPALNDMIGDFGTIISSKFTTLLYQGKIRSKWWESSELGDEFRVISSIALFAAFYLGAVSVLIATLQGAPIEIVEALKIMAISFMATATLVMIIFFLAIIGGLWVYKRGKDPNNFLIPITTSVADFSSLILFSLMVAFLF